jgi:DNA-binding transcriptional LysR family regulator
MARFSNSQLAYFVEVAEAGQISRAARTLFLAQPALSQAIMRLERQLGIELLVRHPRGVTLTPAGAIFFEKARAALRAEAEAVATAHSLARSCKGAIVVGFLGAPPPLIAPHILEAFAADCPDAEVTFRELRFPTSSAVDWLADVDVALCYSPPSHPEVQMQTLWHEPRCVLLPAAHPLSKRRELKVADVLHEPFYRCDPSVDPAWAGFWNLDDHRGGPPGLVTNDAPTNSLELVAALTAGRAISTLPLTVAEAIAAVTSRLVALPLRDAAPATCNVVWHTPVHNTLTTAFAAAALDATPVQTSHAAAA